MHNNGPGQAAQGNTPNAQEVAPAPIMELNVLLFASLKDAAGAEQIRVQIPAQVETPVTVADFLVECGRQYPVLEAWLPHVRVAVNCAYASVEETVKSGDEIALLPPVSGGAGD